jgi:hypothetical protein
MNKSVNTLLKGLNSSPKHIELLRAVPLRWFFSVKYWPAIDKLMSSQLIIWQFRLPLKTGNLTVNYDSSFKMPLGTLHYFYSDILHIGYIIEFPKPANIENTKTFVSAKLTKSKTNIITNTEQVPKVDHILNNNHISVYAQNNAILIAAKDPKLINHIGSEI